MPRALALRGNGAGRGRAVLPGPRHLLAEGHFRLLADGFEVQTARVPGPG